METRELFERLVYDEPPLTLIPSSAVANGRRAQQHRYAGVAGLLVTVVVIGIGVLVEAQSRPVPSTTPVGSPAPPPTTPSLASVATFSFGSAAQITASNARVYGLLVSYAGGRALVTRGDLTWDTPAITDKTQFVGTQVEYRASAGTGMLRVVTDTAAEAKTRYAGLLSGDLCGQLQGRSTGEGTFVDCVHESLPGGGGLWTYSRRESTPGQITNRDSSSTLGPAVYERDAIVVAEDGSALDLVFQELGSVGGGSVLPLTGTMPPSSSALGDLALDAAATWQPHDGDVAAPTLTGVAQPSMRQALPSLGAPALGSLPFTRARRISASVEGASLTPTARSAAPRPMVSLTGV
ncbi:MAG: hypothetical protein QOJ11_589 [Frankiales bacterium]|jgi:hypothetical protein|nr:hypothetical protein [Frankiales bacterium]